MNNFIWKNNLQVRRSFFWTSWQQWIESLQVTNVNGIIFYHCIHTYVYQRTFSRVHIQILKTIFIINLGTALLNTFLSRDVVNCVSHTFDTVLYEMQYMQYMSFVEENPLSYTIQQIRSGPKITKLDSYYSILENNALSLCLCLIIHVPFFHLVTNNDINFDYQDTFCAQFSQTYSQQYSNKRKVFFRYDNNTKRVILFYQDFLQIITQI